MRNPKREYVCIKCGLRVAGRLKKDGLVYPYDKSAVDPKQMKPDASVCIRCAEKEAT